jgi:hypothetical protein
MSLSTFTTRASAMVATLTCVLYTIANMGVRERRERIAQRLRRLVRY